MKQKNNYLNTVIVIFFLFFNVPVSTGQSADLDSSLEEENKKLLSHYRQQVKELTVRADPLSVEYLKAKNKLYNALQSYNEKNKELQSAGKKYQSSSDGTDLFCSESIKKYEHQAMGYSGHILVLESKINKALEDAGSLIKLCTTEADGIEIKKLCIQGKQDITQMIKEVALIDELLSKSDKVTADKIYKKVTALNKEQANRCNELAEELGKELPGLKRTILKQMDQLKKSFNGLEKIFQKAFKLSDLAKDLDYPYSAMSPETRLGWDKFYDEVKSLLNTCYIANDYNKITADWPELLISLDNSDEVIEKLRKVKPVRGCDSGLISTILEEVSNVRDMASLKLVQFETLESEADSCGVTAGNVPNALHIRGVKNLVVGMTMNYWVQDDNGKPYYNGVNWDVSDASVLSISNSGVVKAKRPGNCRIFAKIGNANAIWDVIVDDSSNNIEPSESEDHGVELLGELSESDYSFESYLESMDDENPADTDSQSSSQDQNSQTVTYFGRSWLPPGFKTSGNSNLTRVNIYEAASRIGWAEALAKFTTGEADSYIEKHLAEAVTHMRLANRYSYASHKAWPDYNIRQQKYNSWVRNLKAKTGLGKKNHRISMAGGIETEARTLAEQIMTKIPGQTEKVLNCDTLYFLLGYYLAESAQYEALARVGQDNNEPRNWLKSVLEKARTAATNARTTLDTLISGPGRQACIDFSELRPILQAAFSDLKRAGSSSMYNCWIRGLTILTNGTPPAPQIYAGQEQQQQGGNKCAELHAQFKQYMNSGYLKEARSIIVKARQMNCNIPERDIAWFNRALEGVQAEALRQQQAQRQQQQQELNNALGLLVTTIDNMNRPANPPDNPPIGDRRGQPSYGTDSWHGCWSITSKHTSGPAKGQSRTSQVCVNLDTKKVTVNGKTWPATISKNRLVVDTIHPEGGKMVLTLVRRNTKLVPGSGLQGYIGSRAARGTYTGYKVSN